MWPTRPPPWQSVMGLTFSKVFGKLFGKKDVRILMVGLDAAGKVHSATSNAPVRSCEDCG